MKIEQIYTGCISHAAYYIESNQEVAIFDPLREVEPYLEKATKNNASIKYIFETHFHADFVSGHLDLAKKSGAKIVYGPTAKPNFDAIIAQDNQEFKLGDITIRAIHTPGHTLESTCYLIIDPKGKKHGIITGDTLFIGDVGRPDLAQKIIEDLTEQKLAGYLFDSLRKKIMPLDDHLIVYPNHGAGSACGKNLSKETTDTLGNQKKTNYALRADMTKEEFIKEVLEGLTPPPAYFPQNVLMNIEGYSTLDSIIEKGNTPLSVEQFKQLSDDNDVIILDVRSVDQFTSDHIPNSIFIGLQGNFAPWVGALIKNTNQKIALVTSQGKEQEAITRLSRVGFDNTIGYLDGGISAWKKAGFNTERIENIHPNDLSKIASNVKIVDARKTSEFSSTHIKNAINIPLDTVSNTLDQIPKNETFYLHCAGGYRSVIMGSILKSKGIHNFINVELGLNGIKKTSIELTDFVCPSS